MNGAGFRRTVLGLLLAAGAHVAGASFVGVGDSAVDGSFLKPYTNRWKMVVTMKEDGRTVEAGSWTDALVRQTVNGKAAFRREQVTTFAKLKEPSVDVNVFDAATMAPIWSEVTGTKGDHRRRDFRGATVTQVARPAPDAKEDTTEATFEQPVFDFYGGMWGLLLAGLPLRAGYEATLPSVGEFRLTYETVTARVVRRERVDAGGSGQVNAWVVEARTTQGLMTFWLTKEAPYVIRLLMADARGNVWDFRMT